MRVIPKRESIVNIIKHWVSLLILLAIGVIGLIAAAFAANGNCPTWFANLSVPIASVSGILVGVALGALLELGQSYQQLRLLRASFSLLVLGLMFVLIGGIPSLQYLDIDQWRDVYSAAGGAFAGSTLSFMLAHVRSSAAERC